MTGGRQEAERVLADLRDRAARFGRGSASGQARLIECWRFAAQTRRLRRDGTPETSYVLGFTQVVRWLPGQGRVVRGPGIPLGGAPPSVNRLPGLAPAASVLDGRPFDAASFDELELVFSTLSHVESTETEWRELVQEPDGRRSSGMLSARP